MANKDVAPGVYVLSQDVALIDALGEAGGDQYPIHVVSTFAELRELVESARCKIVLLDAELLGRSLRSQASELKALEPALVALIAAPREAAENLMGLLSERLIHRLLIKPAAVGITRLLLESAVSRYLRRSALPQDKENATRVRTVITAVTARRTAALARCAEGSEVSLGPGPSRRP